MSTEVATVQSKESEKSWRISFLGKDTSATSATMSAQFQIVSAPSHKAAIQLLIATRKKAGLSTGKINRVRNCSGIGRHEMRKRRQVARDHIQELRSRIQTLSETINRAHKGVHPEDECAAVPEKPVDKSTITRLYTTRTALRNQLDEHERALSAATNKDTTGTDDSHRMDHRVLRTKRRGKGYRVTTKVAHIICAKGQRAVA